MTFPSEFRVWDSEYKRYIDCSIMNFRGNGEHFVKADWNSPVSINESQYTIELFTGLYDKYGTKVYDGDIVELTWATFISIDTAIDIIKDEGRELPLLKDGELKQLYEVYWAEGRGGFALKPVNGEPACIFSLEKVTCGKVVGNRHEKNSI